MPGSHAVSEDAASAASHRGDDGRDPVGIGVGVRGDRELAVGGREGVRWHGQRGDPAPLVHGEDAVVGPGVQTAPDRLRYGLVPGAAAYVVVEGAQRVDRRAVRSAHNPRGVHPGRRYFPPMARPRGAKQRAGTTMARLAEEYPGSAVELCALRHESPFQLLAATILSAQCTDEMVNSVTPILFARYPDPNALASADPAAVEEIVHPTGFFRQKTKSLIGMATAVRDRFDGEVPTELDDLVTLPGVGRKTGNVLRSVAYDLPGLPVDTHVGRLATRLKLTNETDPVKVELDLNGLVPPEDRGAFSLRLILHGRRVCVARKPLPPSPRCRSALPGAWRGGCTRQPSTRPTAPPRRPRTSALLQPAPSAEPARRGERQWSGAGNTEDDPPGPVPRLAVGSSAVHLHPRRHRGHVVVHRRATAGGPDILDLLAGTKRSTPGSWRRTWWCSASC